MTSAPGTIFRMKHFEVDQTGAAMKVNTDGLCLGAWVYCPGHGHIMDVGSGTGIIALMIAQRYPDRRIIAIEPHLQSFQCLRGNSGKSPWARQLDARMLDLARFTSRFPPASLGHLISNPPYFKNAKLPLKEERRVARHTKSLTTDHLADCAGTLLTDHGLLSVIYPPEQMERMTRACAERQLYPVRRCAIRSRAGEKTVRVMQTFCLGNEKREIAEEELIIYQHDGTFTDPYRALLRDFLLIF